VSEDQWTRVLDVIGRQDLKGNPDYGSREKRHAREAEINAMIEAWSSTLSRDEAFATMRENRVPVAPIRNLEDVRNDPHMHARGMLQRMTHPDMGEIVLPRSPIGLSDYEQSELAFFPDTGANSIEVLGDWLGLSEAEIAGLSEDGVMPAGSAADRLATFRHRTPSLKVASILSLSASGGSRNVLWKAPYSRSEKK
jgi:CoA:oxalate CoA-transferase